MTIQRDLDEKLTTTIAQTPPLAGLGKSLSKFLTQTFLESPLYRVKNFLNGTWLDHPLHPVLTDVPVGVWTAAMALDLLSLFGDSKLDKASGILTGMGVAGATGAAVTGLMDFTDTGHSDRTIAATHGVINILGTALFAASFIGRWRNRWRMEPNHLLLSTLGYLTITAGAYLGGSLVYRHGVMVNRNAFTEGPDEFTPALEYEQLEENKPVRVLVNGVPVLLVRSRTGIHAVGAVCSHLGGPLEQGEFDADTIKCPWHYSVYSVQDGAKLEGPTTAPIPVYATRVKNGQIEVKLAKAK